MNPLYIFTKLIDEYLLAKGITLEKSDFIRTVCYRFNADDKYALFYLSMLKDGKLVFRYRLNVNSRETQEIDITEFDNLRFKSEILPIVKATVDNKPETILQKEKKENKKDTKKKGAKEKHCFNNQQMALDIYDTLKDIQSKGKAFGVTVLVAILRGTQLKRITNNNLDSVVNFAKYKDIKKAEVEEVVKKLIDEGIIGRLEGMYPILYLKAPRDSIITLYTNEANQENKRRLENQGSYKAAYFSVDEEETEQETEFDFYNKRIDRIINSNSYIARSSFLSAIEETKEYLKQISFLMENDLLDSYCEKNKITVKSCLELIEKVNNIEDIVKEHNVNYIERAMNNEREYLDNVLKDIDPNINLDDDQRRAVLTDEDNCLIIAGAGAGKTTTVSAKVKYLVDKKGIRPEEILVISFTNKAVDELRDRINNLLEIPCKISTFHSVGYSIMKEHADRKLNIVDDVRLFYVLDEYLKKEVLSDESMVDLLIAFFASYFDVPADMGEKELKEFFNNIAKANYTTLRSDLDEFNEEVTDRLTRQKRTINNEVLRSYQEVRIANFLYLNSIDYDYEPLYDYQIEGSDKPYTPDFLIRQGGKETYIEHFAISENGTNSRFSEKELKKYKKAINDKIRLHKEHGTDLIYTFSRYNDGKDLIDHLKEKLEERGFVLKERSKKEVFNKLVNIQESKYIRKLIVLLSRYISNFKVNNYAVEDFVAFRHETKSERTKLFLEIAERCYLKYEQYLRDNNAVDFSDMINESEKILTHYKVIGKRLDYKYVIVDEYQDISRQRFDLVTALKGVSDAKFIAVGDDWQSIYAFSGSDITLFTDFENKVGYAERLIIQKTYRNSQEIIDIAGNFIQKNTSQIKKSLISPKHIDNPIVVYTYDSEKKGKDGTGGINYNKSLVVEKVIGHILEKNKQEGKEPDSSILILGRYNFDGYMLGASELFEYQNTTGRIISKKFPKANLTFMTAHSSKGLGFDNVIIVNMLNAVYGFPSKVETDPVLKSVIKEDNTYDYAEERRLFYVAMTRTKNRCFLIAPSKRPSEFLVELTKDYERILLLGQFDPDIEPDIKKPCPICGYPLQYRYHKSLGLKLHICTNEPEVCGFISNDLNGGKMSITKCERCRTGYLVVKNGSKGYFLGCTNYKNDGTGCMNSINEQHYLEKLKKANG